MSFSIFDHLEKLVPAGRKNRYHCPVCEKKNFTLDPKTGEYQCWNGCGNTDIREALSPWAEVCGKQSGDRANSRRSRSKKRKPLVKTASPPPNLQLAILPYTPEALQARNTLRNGETTAKEIIYAYSPIQWIKRIEWEDLSKPKGRDKRFEYWSLDAAGKPQMKKGDAPWPAYRIKEALQFGAGKWVIDGEGEKVAEALRSLKYIAITHRTEDYEEAYKLLKEAGMIGIAIAPDNDATGVQKAAKKLAAAHKAGLLAVVISPHSIKPSAPEGWDLADEILGGTMNQDEFRKKLEEAIANATAYTFESVEEDPDQRLRLEILNYSNEPDPIKKVRLKTEISRYHGINRKDLEVLSDTITGNCSKPKAKLYTGAEFLKLEPEGLQWIIPGIVPVKGLTLLGGNPGAGKTTLAYDAAACVLYGEEFLGEKPTRTGKVLFVSADEQPAFAQDKFVNRGFLFNEDWQFLNDWDVSQRAELESAIENLRPTLLVIDSFAGIHRDPNFDENSSQAKATIYWIEALLTKYGCGAILIHHLNKSKDNKGINKIRGNTAIAAAASAVYVLGEMGSIRTLEAVKIRGAALFRWAVEMSPDEGRWSVTDGKPDDTQYKSMSERIYQMFRSKYPHQKLEFEIIKEEVGGANDNIYKSLSRLCQRGILVKGHGGKDGKTKIWGLPRSQQPTPNDIGQDEVPSPPPSRLKVSNKNAEIHTESKFEVIGHLLDTPPKPIGHFTEVNSVGKEGETSPNPDRVSNSALLDTTSVKECPMASNGDGVSLTANLLDTLPAQGGGGCDRADIDDELEEETFFYPDDESLPYPDREAISWANRWLWCETKEAAKAIEQDWKKFEQIDAETASAAKLKTWLLIPATKQLQIKEWLKKPTSDAESVGEQPTYNGFKVGDRAVSMVTGEEVSIEKFFEKKGVMFAAVRYVSSAYIGDSQYGESRVDWLQKIDTQEGS